MEFHYCSSKTISSTSHVPMSTIAIDSFLLFQNGSLKLHLLQGTLVVAIILGYLMLILQYRGQKKVFAVDCFLRQGTRVSFTHILKSEYGFICSRKNLLSLTMIISRTTKNMQSIIINSKMTKCIDHTLNGVFPSFAANKTYQ